MSAHYVQFQKVAVDRVERVRFKLGLRSSVGEQGAERAQLLSRLRAMHASHRVGPEALERLHAKDLPLDTFMRKHDKLCRPVLLQGLLEEWKAMDRWSLYNLVSRQSDDEFVVGLDRHRRQEVSIKMKYFAYYLKEYRDTTPFQINDDLSQGTKKRLRDDYEVPSYFKDDVFKYAQEPDLPPMRIFQLGPPLAGDRIQCSPYQCNYWNALVHGSRRWCLFSHHTPQDLVCQDPRSRGRRLDSAVAWFERIYPRTQSSRWPRYFKPLEVVQGPGDVVFVPAGWWYVWINLEVSVSISHQHCSPVKISSAWPRIVRGNHALERSWYDVLRRRRPELAVLVHRGRRTRRQSSDSDSETRSKTVDTTFTSCTTERERDISEELVSDNS